MLGAKKNGLHWVLLTACSVLRSFQLESMALNDEKRFFATELFDWNGLPVYFFYWVSTGWLGLSLFFFFIFFYSFGGCVVDNGPDETDKYLNKIPTGLQDLLDQRVVGPGPPTPCSFFFPIFPFFFLEFRGKRPLATGQNWQHRRGRVIVHRLSCTQIGFVAPRHLLFFFFYRVLTR